MKTTSRNKYIYNYVVGYTISTSLFLLIIDSLTIIYGSLYIHLLPYTIGYIFTYSIHRQESFSLLLSMQSLLYISILAFSVFTYAHLNHN